MHVVSLRSAPPGMDATGDGTRYVLARDIALDESELPFPATGGRPSYRAYAASQPHGRGQVSGIDRSFERSLLASGGPEVIVLNTSVMIDVRTARLAMLERRGRLENADFEEGDPFTLPEAIGAPIGIGHDAFAFRLRGLLLGDPELTVLFVREDNVIFEVVVIGDPAATGLGHARDIAEAAHHKLARASRQDPAVFAQAPLPTQIPVPGLRHR